MTVTPIVRQVAQTAPLKWLIIGETFSLVVCLDADYVTATFSVFLPKFQSLAIWQPEELDSRHTQT